MLRGRRLIVEIVYDDAESSDPLDWNWNELCDLAYNEQVTLSVPAESCFEVPEDLAAELEDRSLDY